MKAIILCLLLTACASEFTILPTPSQQKPKPNPEAPDVQRPGGTLK